MTAKKNKSERDHILQARAALLDVALPNVVFDGWSNALLSAAISDADLDEGLAQQACPRGGIDLAVAYHNQGDAELADRLENADLSKMRIRDRIAFAVRTRLELADKEAVRAGSSLFALPANMTEGAGLIWQTADLIWNALGDRSDDFNWYSKRVILSGVYSSTVLYWLGDDSENHSETWAFLDRRIENVMQIEKAKARLRDTPFGHAIDRFASSISKPKYDVTDDLPGKING